MIALSKEISPHTGTVLLAPFASMETAGRQNRIKMTTLQSAGAGGCLEENPARIYTEHSSIFMFIKWPFDKRGKRARSGPSLARSCAKIVIIPVFVVAAFLAGCGGGSSSANNTVAQVVVTPTNASLVAGQVLALSTSAVNSANASVATTFTFNSSNTKVATISPRGEVCGGIWDSLFVVCNGTDALGNPVSGTAIITATAAGVTSGPVTVAVHPSVTSVSVEPVGGCFSAGQTHQFKAHAFHNGQEITDQVGNVTWASADTTVVTVDANGLATAKTPGLGGIIATIGSTTSPAVSFKTCMVVQIVLHLDTDPAGTVTTSATMNVSDTKGIHTDGVDENGTLLSPTPATIFSNNPLVATASGGTITAASPGGAGFVASCTPPTCGNGLNTPIYSNVFSVTVSGASPNTTTVYAASAFPVPTGTIMPLIPIDASKSPPTAGAAIPLPGVPNSIVFDRSGARAFIGTNAGLAVLDAAGNTVTLAAPAAVGKVLAVSPDGNKVIVSNAANDPATGTAIEPVAANQRVWVFDRAASTLTTFVSAGAVAASYDDDSFKAFIVANNGNIYVFSPLLTFLTESIGGVNKDAATLASGPFVYVANAPDGLDVLSTCNNTQQPTANNPPTNSANIQLVGAVKNTDQIVAVDSTGVNIETVHVTPLTAPIALTSANCAPGVSYTNQFFDFGLGAFTARQLLVASNNAHYAVLAAGLNRVLTVLPGVSTGVAVLAGGGTEPLSGGMTPDGDTLWVGVAGSNNVDRINLRNNQDEVQIPMSFKKADGSPAPPNLVAVRPK